MVVILYSQHYFSLQGPTPSLFISTTPPTGKGHFETRIANKQSKYDSINTANVSSTSSDRNLAGSLSSINSLETTDRSHWSTLTGSCSTIALSDIDSSSLTHVSLDDVDGNSTTSPASSTLSLCWDTDGTPNPTPAATPARSRPQRNSHVSSPVIETDAFNSRHSDQKILYKNESITSDFILPEQCKVAAHRSLKIQSNQSNSTHASRVPSIADSYSSSASQTPTLTPSLIPPMEPLDTVYLLKRNNDNNNNNNSNKASIFQFPEEGATQPSISSLNCSSHQASKRGLGFVTQSSPVVTSSSPHNSNNRRSSSPVISYTGTDSQAYQTSAINDKIDSCHEQMSRRRSGGNDLLSPTDSGFGSPSAYPQPKMAVQPFHHIPPSMSISSANTANVPANQHQSNSKSVPFIKPQLLREARLDSSKFTHNQPQGMNFHENGLKKPLNVSKGIGATCGSRHSSQESLSSQQSSNSASKLMPKMSKTDLSQPSMRPGTSSESLHSNSSAGRSDSYRVALLAEADQISLIQDKKHGFSGQVRTTRTGSLVEKGNINNNSGIDRSRSSSLSSSQAHPKPKISSPSPSQHPHLNKSMSAPSTTMNNMNLKNNFYKNYAKNGSSLQEESVSRADSYRCAMRSSQDAFLHGDVVGRNSSYRLATHDEDDEGIVVNLGAGNSRMDACNMWTGKSGTSRDVRRMGITDVDQLKSIPVSNGTGARPVTDTQHARKKFGVKTDGVGAGASTIGDQKKSLRHGSGHGGVAGVTLRDKSNKQQKLQSSSYIRFDPIFESGEDLRGSKESLRPPSIISVRTAMAASKETLVSVTGSSIGQGEGHRGSKSPARRRSGSQGQRRSGAEDGSRNGGLSIFGSIKTTIKSIGSGKGE